MSEKHFSRRDFLALTTRSSAALLLAPNIDALVRPAPIETGGVCLELPFSIIVPGIPAVNIHYPIVSRDNDWDPRVLKLFADWKRYGMTSALVVPSDIHPFIILHSYKNEEKQPLPGEWLRKAGEIAGRRLSLQQTDSGISSVFEGVGSTHVSEEIFNGSAIIPENSSELLHFDTSSWGLPNEVRRGNQISFVVCDGINKVNGENTFPLRLISTFTLLENRTRRR